MKKSFLKILVFVFTSANLSAENPKNTLAIKFTENKGQIHDQNYKPRPDVLFGGNINGMTFHLRNGGISYQFYKGENRNEINVKEQKFNLAEKRALEQMSIYRLDINWLNCNNKTIIQKGKRLSGHENYYLEVCPEGITNVESFEEVIYKNIYKNIDLHYYSTDSGLKYDYVLLPYTDYRQIKFEVKGHQTIKVNGKGELVIKTLFGEIIEGAPIVKQDGKILIAKWCVNNNIVSFDIQNYNLSLPLIIDPAIRIWGTYYGGVGQEESNSCSRDYFGNIYMCGQASTTSGNIIATSGSHQTTHGGATYDAFLVKFDKNGMRLWGTYYGGTGSEWAWSCTADKIGNIYLAGYTDTSTPNVIATPLAHQTIHGGMYDAFLVKFDSLGVRQWGTYYGGSDDDRGVSTSTDNLNNVYLIGSASILSASSVFVTPGAHQATQPGGNDVFIVKFDGSGNRQWGTLYGGTLGDIAISSVVDKFNNLYIAGYVASNTGTYIATPGAQQPLFGGGMFDGFVVKFRHSGVRVWGTYYGGTGIDRGYGCAVDTACNVYLTGDTDTPTSSAIASPSGHQSAYGGNTDAFLVQLDSNGIRQWGTYYGGSGSEYAYSCAIDDSSNVCFTGSTLGAPGNVIVTPNSHQTIYGGATDAFLSLFSSNGTRKWGTYYGGAWAEYGYWCTTSGSSDIYVSGVTRTTTSVSISTSNAHQTIFGGGNWDAFLVKMNNCTPPPPPLNTTPAINLSICNNNSTNLSVNGVGSVSWYASSTSTVPLGTGMNFVTPVLSTGTYTYFVEDFTCTNSSLRTPIIVTVYAAPSVTVSGPIMICSGDSVGLYVLGAANSYTWNTGATTSSIVITPITTVIYSVAVTNTNGCVGTASLSINVNPNPTVTTITSNTLICTGQTVTLTASGANSYTWNTSSLGSVIVVSPTITTTYSVTGTDLNGCSNTTAITQSVSACTGIGEIATQSGIIIYPNPTTEIINIQSYNKVKSIKIFSVDGKLVLEKAVKENNFSFNISELSHGIYFLCCITESGEKYFKVVKE